MGLTNKQRVFVEEYLHSFNATEAALKAGYSERTAYSIGHENLRKPEIASFIKERINEKTMQADEVLLRLSDQARGLPVECLRAPSVLGWTVDFEKLKELGLTHLIKKLTYDDDGNLKTVDFYNAQRALELLGKHRQLFVERIKHEDWRTEAIEAIKRREIGFEELANEFDRDLATELFKAAGISVEIATSEGTNEG